MSNAIEINGTQQVVITETAINAVELAVPAAPAVVEVSTTGPQGPQGPAAVSNLYEMQDVNINSKVNQSVLYYDSASGKWKGDSIYTVLSLVDGGNW